MWPAGNLDVTAYGASTFKAPYALYLCETQLDTELAALDTPCFEAPATAFMDPTGTYLYDGLASYPLGTLIADSVTQSDNDSYRILRASYDAAGFSAWIADRGLPANLTDDWFPTYSTRTSGMLWLLAAQHLDGDAALRRRGCPSCSGNRRRCFCATPLPRKRQWAGCRVRPRTTTRLSAAYAMRAS